MQLSLHTVFSTSLCDNQITYHKSFILNSSPTVEDGLKEEITVSSVSDFTVRERGSKGRYCNCEKDL